MRAILGQIQTALIYKMMVLHLLMVKNVQLDITAVDRSFTSKLVQMVSTQTKPNSAYAQLVLWEITAQEMLRELRSLLHALKIQSVN